ncbi:hypothetical protein ACSBR1_043615 [Camellia fascicularis]
MLENEANPYTSKTTHIGCGFGGLLISLSTIFPDTLMIRMELGDKVTEYVKEQTWKKLGRMKACLERHAMFEALTNEELEADHCEALA